MEEQTEEVLILIVEAVNKDYPRVQERRLAQEIKSSSLLIQVRKHQVKRDRNT